MCVPPGGSISLVGNGIAYNVSGIAEVVDFETQKLNNR